MDTQQASNDTTCFHQANETDDHFITIHILIGNRKEIASFRPNQVTNLEVKELFRNAAEAGPLDIVKLRKADKLVNISSSLLGNSPDDPYILQVVGIHPETSGIIEANWLRTLENRIATLEWELNHYREAWAVTSCLSLQEVKKQVDSFKEKLETTEHLSWLGFYKQLPEPVSSAACCCLQYRRKSNSLKRRVRERFLQICDIALVSHVRELMRSPKFDTRPWEDEELLLMLQTMFIELELLQKYNIALTTLRNFIFEVYNHYNEVPFHNFRHCFCVAQMMYAIVWAADLVSKIGDLEVFILLVSCICHDLDHPGYNNIYQINARTELALRYNDISPLENHHCSVAFRVLEAPECNILASLDSVTYRTVREGIIRCILATDMARHNEILAQFTDALPVFDYNSKAHINLLSMVLIKVADISNEARPMDVAEPWLDSLLQEFFKQSDAEKLEGLPVTPFMDRDKVTKPSSQCSFIGLVLLPLFEALGGLFPVLQELIVEPVRYALDYYRRLNEAAKDERHQRKSIVELADNALGSQVSSSRNTASTECQEQVATVTNHSSIHLISKVKQSQQQKHHHHYYKEQLQQTSKSVIKSTSTNSMHSERSISIFSGSRSIEGEEEVSRFKNLLENEEVIDLSSSDPETATEVEVSEKTLKFKISTEGASGSERKSYPGSRKGSREKSSLDYHNYELAKVIRERERRKSRCENLHSELNSPQSALSNEEMRIFEELERDDQHHVELLFTEDQPIPNNCLIPNTAQQYRNKHLNKRTLSCDNTATNTDRYQCFHPVNPIDNSVVSTAQVISSSSQKNKVRYTDAIYREQLAYCCCADNPDINNHKSLLSRLRNFTDRLSISFDSKTIQVPKNSKCSTVKSLNKSLSLNATSPSLRHQQLDNTTIMCKKCNLSKLNEQLEKRSMTLPKVKHLQNGKQKSWRTVFAKEKRPTMSLETLPADVAFSNTSNRIKHRPNLSNLEGKSILERNTSPIDPLNCINFKEIDFRPNKPEIIIDQLNLGSSSAIADIGIVEIRRSSASVEDISKITKQSELGQYLLGYPFEQQGSKSDEFQQHTGSLDSMLCKEAHATHRQNKSSKPAVDRQFANFMTDSPTQPKKSLSGLFSRFKSGMSIDGTRSSSNSDSLHEQQQQQPQQSWISSLTASFRPKRQAYQQPVLLPQLSTSSNREDVK